VSVREREEVQEVGCGVMQCDSNPVCLRRNPGSGFTLKSHGCYPWAFNKSARSLGVPRDDKRRGTFIRASHLRYPFERPAPRL